MDRNDVYTVYIHINTFNNKMYVGITCQKPEDRWENGSGYSYNEHFFRAIRKYGWDNFEHQIVASNLTKEEACGFERLLIKKLNSNNPNFGYNKDEGGGLPPIMIGKDNPFFQDHRFAGENHPMFGKHHDEKTKKKMSENHWNTSGGNNPNAKKVICIESGKIYPSAIDAQNDTGVPRNNITAACRKDRQKTAGGFHWEFVA
jgi:group I intron endonuclease